MKKEIAGEEESEPKEDEAPQETPAGQKFELKPVQGDDSE
jgi:hypothetical protein